MNDQNDIYAINSNNANVHYDKFVVEENRSQAKNLKCKYALLPVWFSRVEYKGLYYSVAVNGQTGKIAGHMPVSDLKAGMKYRRKKLKYEAGFWGTVFVLSALITGPFLPFQFYFGSHDLNAIELVFLWLFSLMMVTGALAILNNTNLSEKSSVVLSKLYEKHVTKKLREVDDEIKETNTRPPAYVYMNSSEKVEMEATDVIDTAVERYFPPEEQGPTI